MKYSDVSVSPKLLGVELYYKHSLQKKKFSLSTSHHFQCLFYPSEKNWKVSQFAVLYQGPTKGNTHTHTHTSLWKSWFASGRFPAVFRDMFFSDHGFFPLFFHVRCPRCIIRLLKVLQKVFHRTQRLLNVQRRMLFSSNSYNFNPTILPSPPKQNVGISSLFFLLPAFDFFPFLSQHQPIITIHASVPPSRR